MKILNEDTSEIIPVYLFVTTLSYSQYPYVEATLSMNEESWIKCHINMFNYFKGTTIRLSFHFCIIYIEKLYLTTIMFKLQSK